MSAAAPPLTAIGSISCTDGAIIKCVFNIGGRAYTFDATITSGNPGNFSAPSATLTYARLTDLTQRRSCTGLVGVNKVVINVVNGPIIEGDLTQHVNPAVGVDAEGPWSHT